MGVKRKAKDAFGKATVSAVDSRDQPQQQISAFAAAKSLGTAAVAVQNGHAGFETHTADHLESQRKSNAQSRVPQTPNGTVSGDALSSLSDSSVSPSEESPWLTSLRPDVKAEESIRLTSSRPDVKVIDFNPSVVEIEMSQDAFLTILGVYQLEVLTGLVTIYGAAISPRTGAQKVYALEGINALPQIVSRAKVTRLRISSTSSSIQKLSRLSSLFRNISIFADEGQARSFRVLETKTSPAWSPLTTSRQYQSVLSQIATKVESSREGISVACIGGKSSGKSTFARHISNKLLSRSSESCYFLDIDPGQPEFGPPGQIYLVEVKSALLGPPFTHLASRNDTSFRLVAAHTIAATTFKNNSQHYFDCVKHLLGHAQLVAARQQKVPLIINICGWMNDLGAQVITDLLGLGVTDVVLIDITDTALVNAARSLCQDKYELSKPDIRRSTRVPVAQRHMQTMAYFHTRSAASGSRIVGNPISKWLPWVIHYGAPKAAVKGILSYSAVHGPEYLVEQLDGAIVALVTVDDNTSEELEVRQTDEGLPCLERHGPLPPSKVTFTGLALVRAIDLDTQDIHLLTPLVESEMAALMQKSVVLVRGSFDCPDWAYLEDREYEPGGPVALDRPWVAQSGGETGIEGAVWRIRHPPMRSKAF